MRESPRGESRGATRLMLGGAAEVGRKAVKHERSEAAAGDPAAVDRGEGRVCGSA
jgi:hypothetical protein